MMHHIVGAFLWLCEVAYDAKGWVRKQWRRHIAMDEPKCRSCHHYVTLCDCTKANFTLDTTTNRPRVPLTRSLYAQMVGRGKRGLPVGRKVGRPTRRA